MHYTYVNCLLFFFFQSNLYQSSNFMKSDRILYGEMVYCKSLFMSGIPVPFSSLLPSFPAEMSVSISQ